jgi:iron complex transport system ATP-binding protein
MRTGLFARKLLRRFGMEPVAQEAGRHRLPDPPGQNEGVAASSASPEPTDNPGASQVNRSRPAVEFVLPEDPNDLVVHMSGVGVRRGRSTLLDRLDWAVELDERWVVLGPNGAGKTTLLRIAAAELHPTSGVAHVLGERLGRTDVFELRPRIGFASAALAARVPADETVRDLVLSAGYAVVGRWREHYDEIDAERAEELMKALGVAHLADRAYGTLSEGERKRTLIARSLMTDPELLLMDEPAAGLDLGGREDLVGRLSMLAKDPDAPAIVLVTHHVEEIPPGFTNALLLRDGRAVAAGPIDDVLTAENLSATFGEDLLLEQWGERYFARRR